MTNLLDVTIQHQGWNGPDFINGGWVDFTPMAVTGLQARSYWAQSLNGLPIDQAARFSVGGDTSQPLWFNLHASGQLQGATNPSPYLVPVGGQVWTYTRTPSSTSPILWRLIVSDQPTTPPPTTPP